MSNYTNLFLIYSLKFNGLVQMYRCTDVFEIMLRSDEYFMLLLLLLLQVYAAKRAAMLKVAEDDGLDTSDKGVRKRVKRMR